MLLRLRSRCLSIVPTDIADDNRIVTIATNARAGAILDGVAHYRSIVGVEFHSVGIVSIEISRNVAGADDMISCDVDVMVAWLHIDASAKSPAIHHIANDSVILAVRRNI